LCKYKILEATRDGYCLYFRESKKKQQYGLPFRQVEFYNQRRDSQRSINIKAAYLHLFSDAVSSVGVVLGGIAIHFWHIYWIDPALTIAIGIYILKESYQILMQDAAIPFFNIN